MAAQTNFIDIATIWLHAGMKSGFMIYSVWMVHLIVNKKLIL